MSGSQTHDVTALVARSLDRELADLTKSCVYIPPSSSPINVNEETSTEPVRTTATATWQWRDLPSGSALREKVSERAWKRCLRRIHKIVESIHGPLANAIAACVHAAHADVEVLPGLPYPELPVIALSGGTSSLHDSVLARLSSPPADESPALHVHLHPAECTTLLAAMRALVSGFVFPSGQQAKRPAVALAGYDINLLKVWYASLDEKPPLVVILHEFEQLTPTVAQDVFEICSLHVASLPLVFVLLLSGPSPTAALQTYPRATCALLRVHSFTAPPGAAVIAEVVSKTFFDTNFEPDIMLGPAALEYVLQFVERYGGGVDFLQTVLHLAHMKHVTEPLTLLMRPLTLSKGIFDSPSSRPFLFALNARLRAHPDLLPDADANVQNLTADADLTANANGCTTGDIPAETPIPAAPVLLCAVSTAHTAFRRAARRLRVAFAVMLAMQRALASDNGARAMSVVNGVKGKGKERAIEETNKQSEVGLTKEGLETLELMCTVLRGRGGREARYFGAPVEKLPMEKLRILLQNLHTLFAGLGDEDNENDAEALCARLDTALAQLPDDVEDNHASTAEIATGVSEWLIEYLEARLVRLDDCPLWDVWYMGATPFPAELINPAPRPTIVSALLHPHAFADAHEQLFRMPESSQPREATDAKEQEDDGGRTCALWELPDTSILFHRCAEAGRMVNVYDWFQAFAVVLDEQRRRLRRMQRAESGLDVKANGKEKGKERAAEQDMDVDEQDVDEEEGEGDDEEEWRVEVQARFVRALHELDYMGFVKPTGRKADHIVRTTFDLPD